VGIDESMAEAAAERLEAAEYRRQQRLQRGERLVERITWGINREPRTRVSWLNRRTGEIEYQDYVGHHITLPEGG
jgi:hypothetical protein